MTALVVVRPVADRDIQHAMTWYLDNAPEQVPRLASDLADTVNRVRDRPLLGRAVYGDVRRVALRKFPYLVWFVYFEDADTIHVLGFSHQRRDPNQVIEHLPT